MIQRKFSLFSRLFPAKEENQGIAKKALTLSNAMINSNIIENSNLLRKCLIFYNMVGGEQDIDDISFENIKNINFVKFKTQLKPVMAKSDKLNLEEAKTKVISFLKALITIDEGEKKFIEKFRNKNYMPELLFDDEATIDNIKFHPMALWRCPCTMESSCKTSNAEMK